MKRRNICDLPPAPAGFRADKETRREDGKVIFETLGDCRREDEERAKRLRRAAKRFPMIIEPFKANELADRIDPAKTGRRPPQTPASSLYMREQRKRITAALWPLVEEEQQAITFTLIPRTWEFHPDALMDVNPVDLMSELNSDLYRCGAGRARGYLFTGSHGEFDAGGNVYRLHDHGIAVGEMIMVVDRLRKLRKYKAGLAKSDGSVDPVARRVRRSRKPLMNLPDPLSYLVQSFWPSRPTFQSEDGKWRRVREKRRLKDPYHSQMLLWLDQWELPDLTLMIGLKVTESGLIRTKP